MEITVVLFEGFDELDAIGPYEVFSHAARMGAGLSVSLCTIESTDPVTAANGLSVVPDLILADADPDLIVVPGGGWNDRRETGARAEVDRGTLPDALARLHDEGTMVASVCTGGMVLAHAGLLDDRPAVTHAGAIAALRKTNAEVVDARVVDDGDVLTAGGVTSGIDLAFHLLDREFGADVARSVSETMEYDPSEDIYG